MSLFLILFFALYGLLHVYAFRTARCGTGFGRGAGIVLAAFMVLMVVAPAGVRLLEKNELRDTARILAYAGYGWMGVVFLFVVAALILDLWCGAVAAAGKATGIDFRRGAPGSPAKFIVAAAVAFAVNLYGFFEAADIRTEHVRIRTEKLAPAARMRLAQISDVHIGLIIGERRLTAIADRLRAASPDLVVSTGDLLDGSADGVEALAPILGSVRPPLGKLAVTGNHEFYGGIDKTLAFTEQAGFTVLRGAHVVLPGGLVVAGVDDAAGIARRDPVLAGDAAVLKTVPAGRFVLFLKHRPLVGDATAGLFDLQLSGHTHRGQIFPFYFVTKLFFPLNSGLRDLGGEKGASFAGQQLYTSRGTGTWGPPVRFLSPPEVTIIDIEGPEIAGR